MAPVRTTARDRDGLRAVVTRAAGILAAAGVPSPEYDAEELAAASLGVERRELRHHDRPGPDFLSWVSRRAAREPLQHITGRSYFRHVELAVGPGVFLPRPETELVAGVAIEFAQALPAPVIVDLCTGSGAIAVSIADEAPHAVVHAVELDPAAHAYARRNCADRAIDLRLGDMADAFADLDGKVDVVVANPPYIPVGSLIRDPEVAEHDPAMALWSGTDGLDDMRVVEGSAARLLRPGGLLAVEHADLQGESAPSLFRDTGCWLEITDHRDLTGRPRFVTARRAGGGRTPAGAIQA